MKKHFLFLKRIHRLSFLQMYRYRSNFLIFILLLPVFFTLEILSIYFVFIAADTQALFGFKIYEVLFVSMLGVFIYQICGLGTLVNDDIGESVQHGRLDFYLIKPLSPSLQICFRYIYIQGYFILLERFISLLIIAYLGNISFSLIQIFQLFYVIGTSIIIYSSLLLLIASMSFYLQRGSVGLQEAFLSTVESTGNYPKEIYPYWFRRIGLTILPIFLITNPAFQILHNTYSFETILYTAFLSLAFTVLSLILWYKGIRRYDSAN